MNSCNVSDSIFPSGSISAATRPTCWRRRSWTRSARSNTVTITTRPPFTTYWPYLRLSRRSPSSPWPPINGNDRLTNRLDRAQLSTRESSRCSLLSYSFERGQHMPIHRPRFRAVNWRMSREPWRGLNIHSMRNNLYQLTRTDDKQWPRVKGEEGKNEWKKKRKCNHESLWILDSPAPRLFPSRWIHQWMEKELNALPQWNGRGVH